MTGSSWGDGFGENAAPRITKAHPALPTNYPTPDILLRMSVSPYGLTVPIS